MICQCVDLDLADAARWLIEQKVDLDSRSEVVAGHTDHFGKLRRGQRRAQGGAFHDGSPPVNW
jgi:hypothetical protein